MSSPTETFDSSTMPSASWGAPVAERLGAVGNIAWDVYLIYPRAATWTVELPPPIDWLHQLVANWADPTRRYRGGDLPKALDEAIRRHVA